MSFYRDAAGLLLTSTVGILIGFATSVLLARFLTPEDRGIYALAVSFAMIAATLARLGWPTASLDRLRRMGSSPAEVTSTGIAFVAVLSGVTFLVGWLLEPWLTRSIFEGAPRLMVRLALLSVPALMLGVLIESIARGIDRFAIGNWYRVLLLISIFCAVVGVLVVREGDVVQMMTAYLAVQTACAVGITLVVVRRTRLSASVDLPELVKSAGFALKNYATSLSDRLHERLDVFLIAYFAAPAELAFYVIAVGVVGRMRMLTEALATAAYPQLAGLSEELAAGFVCGVVRQSVLWVLTAGLAIGLVAPLLVPLIYGAPYSESVLPLLLLLPGLLGLTVYRALFRYFMAIDRQAVNIVVQTTALTVNVVLNLLLIPRYGVVGAAVASSVTYLLVGTMIAIVFIRHSGHGLVELLLPRRSDLDAYTSRAARLLRRVLMARDPPLGED